jgi:hypothetical protein
MPRAALLSIHARVAGTTASAWEDPSLVQLWGPRFSVYVVAERDLAVFSLGTLPEDSKRRKKAEDMAARVAAFLDGRRMNYVEVGAGLGLSNANEVRRAKGTGTVLIRWEGARRPKIWIVPAPDVDPFAARLELARRYLHIYGPATGEAFGDWACTGAGSGTVAFEALGGELAAVETPIGEGWILERDEQLLRAGPNSDQPAPVRLLPSGDAYFLLWGRDRELLVPDRERRSELWTSRVWPGALLVGGEIVGTWRRASAVVIFQTWRQLSPAECSAVVAEAESLPLPGVAGQMSVRWVD